MQLTRSSSESIRKSFRAIRLAITACLAWIPLVLAGLNSPQARAQAISQDQVQAGTLGNKVELKLHTASPQDQYVLEARARLLEGEAWSQILRFQGASSPRSFVDAFCGDYNARFFRLRRLLAEPEVQVSNFRLIDTAGAAHELYYQRLAPTIVLVLTGTNAATALPFGPELDKVRKLAGGPGVPVWIITASEPANRDVLAELAKSLPAGIPILEDPSHAVHRTLGSGQSPEALVIIPNDWSIAYRGPIRDSVDTGIGSIEAQPLADAVSEVLAAKTVSVSMVEGRFVPSGVTPLPATSYSAHIAPMLLDACMPCHRPGDIAPWSMTNHNVISQFSRLIKSAVLAGEMPPWHADPKHSSFSNAKALTPNQVAVLVDWIDRGSPRGEGADPLETAAHPVPEDWPLGTPSAIISIDPQEIPATGTVPYRYLLASNPFTSNVWLRAAVVKPGDRTVVHHCLVFKGSFQELLELRGGLGGFFAGYVPGMEQVEYPENTGKLLKPGDLVILQMHYTTSGKPATDRTQLGLYLAPEKPVRELVTTAAYNTSFNIPPQTTDSPVTASRTFTKKSVIYELSPHMHYRGTRARFTLVYPDGKRETLLNVPKYFFDWQALYRLETPKEVPAGTRLVCDGGFDNSVLNRFNPDPTITVKFGEQSWEEMFIGYINFAEVQ